MKPLKYVNERRQQYTSARAKEIEKLAEKAGITDGDVNGNKDAFRHIYAAADSTKKYGATFTKFAGKANEWIKEISDSNPTDEWEMDDYNNAIGAKLGQQAIIENWGDERLSQEVSKVIKNGQAKVLATSNEKLTGYPGYSGEQDSSLKRKQDESRARAVARGAGLFGSWRKEILPELSPAANVLDSILAYFKKEK